MGSGAVTSRHVWLYLGTRRRTHAVPAPGRERSTAVCGTSPTWFDPAGWRGFSGDEKAHAERLDHCARCTRILAGSVR